MDVYCSYLQYWRPLQCGGGGCYSCLDCGTLFNDGGGGGGRTRQQGRARSLQNRSGYRRRCYTHEPMQIVSLVLGNMIIYIVITIKNDYHKYVSLSFLPYKLCLYLFG